MWSACPTGYKEPKASVSRNLGSSDPDKAQKKLDKRMKDIWAERQGLGAFVPKAEKVYVDELLDELEKHYKLSGGRGLLPFQSHLKPTPRRSATCEPWTNARIKAESAACRL